jgi:hypothetical protein
MVENPQSRLALQDNFPNLILNSLTPFYYTILLKGAVQIMLHVYIGPFLNGINQREFEMII